MDATLFLQADHERLKALLASVNDPRADAEARAAAFRAFRRELGVHARVEEGLFYPAVMRIRSPAAREAVRAALGDHHRVDGLLAELDQRDADDPRFLVGAADLRSAIERHLAEEEGALFAEARTHLADERRERLGRRMEALRARLRERGEESGEPPAGTSKQTGA
jgi:hemerythrin HHE cation binding domain-containing protein